MISVALAGCDGVRQPPDEVAPLQEKSLAAAGLQVYWELGATDLPLEGGETLSALYRVGEMVYCLTSRNRLIAVDADTGVIRWAAVVASPLERVFRPSHVRGVSLAEKVPSPGEIMKPTASPLPAFDAVVINSSSQVVVIDRKTGRVVRRIALDMAANCAGATDGTYFYGGTGQGLFFAVSLEQALRSWTASTGDGIAAPLECSGGYLYVASRDGTIRAVKGGRSEDTRKRVLGGPVTAAFYVDNRVCVVPCEDHLLYSFSADLGQRVWDQPFVCGGPLRTPVQVGERTVYQRAQGDKFYAISLASGRQRWTLPTGQQVLAVIGSDVHVRDTQGGLLVVDEVTGAVKKSASLAGLDLFVGNATDPSIWAGRKDGRVLCLRPLSAGRLSAETLRKTQK